MSEDDTKKNISERLKEPTDSRGINYAMIGSIIALVVFGGVYLWANFLHTDPNAQTSLIPPATQTPDERQDNGSLFAGPDMIDPEPVEDPRVSALQAEIAELREQLAGMRKTDETPTGDGQSNEQSDTGGLTEELAGQRAALDRLREDMRKDQQDRDRNHRELMARLAGSGDTDVRAEPANPEDAERAAREAELERLRKAEAERLASPLVGGKPSGNGAKEKPGHPNLTGNEFLDAAAGRVVENAYARKLDDVGRLVPQGTTIPAILETAITSDLPGQLRARVKRDVWSADATNILIPKGSTLIGEYSSDISIGQKRVLVAWNRVITTDYRTINIASRGVDALGRAGLTGNIDHHFGLKFESAFFVSIFTGIAGLTSQAVENESNGARATHESLGAGGRAINNAGKDILDKYLSIPPSIHVDQGADVNIFVSKDLYL